VEWIGLTFGYSLVSALVPVVNAELYLVGLMTRQPQLAWWLVGLAAAAGQMVGKLVYYYAGRGTLQLPARLRRWSRRLARFQQTCHDRPVWTAGVLLASASIGLPPYLAIALLAGVGRVPLPTFLVTGLVGRFARFGAIAASPALINTWWF
jgi:membrane protein YqaA with SNARE-associated domain